MNTNGWKDSQEEEAIKNEEGLRKIVHIKMKEGRNLVRVLHKPKLFRSHWINSVQRSVNCDTTCEICATGDKGKLAYMVNIIDRADGILKLWKLSLTLKQAIETIGDDYGDPINYDLIIVRKGTGFNDTKYTPLPTRESNALTEEEKKLVLYDLDKILAPTPKAVVKSYLNGVVPSKEDRKEKSQATNTSDDLPSLG